MKELLVMLAGVLVLFSCGKKAQPEADLFNQAQQYEQAQNFSQALETYREIANKYENSPNRYKAIFMTGYIQMEYLKDNKKAIESFDLLLEKYPNSDLADDAKALRDAAASGKDMMSIIENNTLPANK